eukprot:CAMPEP_0181061736 /NCGR_PEP_ID=MMETSP1070-20121207/22691_1 /TAXON_ID=265543 /ORGANISM="Minutocellus polymorphus, Strain NH13" /LENGTH=1460 /DNA_ID=CAMNT_0023141733 /DNA_START=161 /DNA_END=4540 /DNA_ORIENTATION=+
MEPSFPLGAQPDPHMPPRMFFDDGQPHGHGHVPRLLVEEMTEDVATWEEIKVTAAFTLVTSLVFLVVFEVSRRKPSVAAVFDRRRSTKPTRTPPPLLVRGGGRGVFEWVFLSTDPAYLEYTAMVHEGAVVRERRRQRRHLRGGDGQDEDEDEDDDYDDDDDDDDGRRGGWWGWLRRPNTRNRRNGGSIIKRVESIESIVEEEMPQEHTKKKKKQPSGGGIPSTAASVASVETIKASGSRGRGQGLAGGAPQAGASASASASASAGAGSSSAYPSASSGRTVGSSSSAKLANADGSSRAGSSRLGGRNSRRRVLFNEEDNEVIDLEAGKRSRQRLEYSNGVDDDEGDASGDESSDDEVDDMLLSPAGEDSPVKASKNGRRSRSAAHGRRRTNQAHLSSIHSTDDDGVEVVASRPLNNRPDYLQTDATKMLTPDVAFVNGRRLPASIAEYAIAGDLAEEQLDQYEEELLQKERKEEAKFRERQQELAARVGGASSPTCADELIVHPPTRLAYFGFQRDNVRQRGFFSRFFYGSEDNIISEGSDGDIFVDEPTKSGSNRTLGSTISAAIPSVMRSKSVGSDSTRSKSVKASAYSSKRINRHLKTTQVTRKRPLTLSDQELLRCIGLDTFVMIRFLRFGFDVTFYPFIAACFFLMPTYRTTGWDGSPVDSESEPTVVKGYFSITMNALPPGSNRLWVCWGFAFVYFFWVLRRLWMEWETFISLRFDFLANGDVEVEKDVGSVKEMKKRLGLGGADLVAQKDDVQLHLEQYRNSCLIEFIPESHRRDRELFEFFDAIFPGQVKRAECLINCTTLTSLIAQRNACIIRYENLYAKQFHAKQAYRRRTEQQFDEDVGVCAYICCRCRGKEPTKPEEPMVRVDGGRWCCGKKMVKALPHLLSEIKRLNREIEKEHHRILQEKKTIEEKGGSSRLLKSTIKQGIKLATGINADSLSTQTGFVEFKSLTAKQSALQCNIVGTTDFMLTLPAPDPRDIRWENVTVEKNNIRFKKMQCNAVLLTGVLFWSLVVTAITSISNLDRLAQWLPGWLIPEPGTFWYGLIQGYLPVVFLEALMLILPIVLQFVGKKYIRFKTKSATDKFVFSWHFAYRVANLIIIILKNQIYEALNSVKDNPSAFLQTLAAGLSVSSQFFLNNMIVATGTETLWELAQMPQMIKYFVMYRYITPEAKSKRYLERLERAEQFEWGHEVPQFIFSLLVGAVYCINVPLVIGICSAYFYVATKVYTHQALFVYAQRYEGGGKLMYYLNRTTFTIVYIAVTIFSINLGLRGAGVQAPSFFVIMMFVTILVDRKIAKNFVVPSTTLALTNARLIDEDSARKEERLQRYKEYKAEKAGKKAAAAIARKEEKANKIDALTERAKDLINSVEQEELLKTPAKATSSDSKTILRLPVLRENTPDQLRQRRAAKLAVDSKGGNRLYGGDDDDDSDGEGGGGVDFYLYRQPQLNKSLW